MVTDKPRAGWTASRVWQGSCNLNRAVAGATGGTRAAGCRTPPNVGGSLKTTSPRGGKQMEPAAWARMPGAPGSTGACPGLCVRETRHVCVCVWNPRCADRAESTGATFTTLTASCPCPARAARPRLRGRDRTASRPRASRVTDGTQARGHMYDHTVGSGVRAEPGSPPQSPCWRNPERRG